MAKQTKLTSIMSMLFICFILMGCSNKTIISDKSTNNDKSGKLNEMVNSDTNELEALSLPILSIELDNDLELSQVERDIYVDASVCVLNSKNYSLTNESLKIKGRGNTTWLKPKKSYKLKFEDKQNLFGMMDTDLKSKHWVIVGNYLDDSLSRNNLAYTLANNVFDHIKYTTKYQDVDLYVNSEYQGVYSIYEHIRVDEGRVDISSEYGILDTGYLLEYDMLANGQEGIDYFRVNGLPYPFRVDSPSPEDLEDEVSYRAQVQYINEYMQKVWDSVDNNDFATFCGLVDIDSVVDVYLLNELFKNSDAGLSSFYVYKEPGGKLYFGPIWDFDKSCQDCWQDNSYEGIFAGIQFDKDAKIIKSSNPFFYRLMENSEFIQIVKNRWNEKRNQVNLEIEKFVDLTLLKEDSYNRNFELWTECSSTPFKDNLIDLKNWLINRVIWLTDNDWKIVNK